MLKKIIRILKNAQEYAGLKLIGMFFHHQKSDGLLLIRNFLIIGESREAVTTIIADILDRDVIPLESLE